MFSSRSVMVSGLTFKANVSLLILFLNYLSIDVSGVLKSPTITVLLSISPFIAVSSCLMYWGAQIGRAHV